MIRIDRGAALLWCIACLWLLPNHSPAQLKPNTTRNSVEYRRVFVPADKLAEMSAGYLPVHQQDFQQLLAAAGASPHASAAANVRLTQATYSARLDQADLVDGKASLTIEHEISNDAILNLEPCTLAVRSPTWNRADKSAARLGMDAAGQLAVVVEPSTGETEAAEVRRATSELQFAWSLRGARDPSGSLVFDVQTPACPSTRIELDLPEGVTPVIDQGLVSRVDTPAAEATRRRWTIMLGGETKATLSIVADETLKQRERFVLLRQATTFDVTAEALETNVEFNLDIYRAPLRKLTLELSPELRVTSLRLGETTLSWNASQSADGKSQQVVVEFPEPITGVNQIMRLGALAPVQRDRVWMLPRVQVAGIVWQQASIALRVDGSLELADLQLQDLQQSKLTTSNAGASAETHHFHCLSPTASLSVMVRDLKPRLKFEEGLTLKWDGAQLTGRLVSNCTSLEGVTLDLQAGVSTGWSIDGVETVPAAALADWSVSGDDKALNLKVRLSAGISPTRPLQLIVFGHRRTAQLDEQLQPHEFRFVDWQVSGSRRRLVSVQTQVQQQLVLTGDIGLRRIDPRSLSETSRSLIDVTGSRLVFEDGTASAAFALNLRSERPRFDAETHSRYVLSRDLLSESHTVHIQPDATPLARLVVRLTAALPRPVQWKLDRDVLGEVSARQLASDSDELWELSFARPQTLPFSIVAERQTTLRVNDPARIVPLAIVQDADTQRGNVTIEAIEGALPLVEQTGLDPLMTATERSSQRAHYRFQPSQEMRLRIGHAEAKQRMASVWAWRQNLVTRVNATGHTVSIAKYQIENTGQPQVVFKLPESSSLHQVKVNGVRLPVSAASGEVSVPLPETDRFAFVQLEYSLQATGLGLWQRIPLSEPTTSMPVLAKDCELWLAPELRFAGRDQGPLLWRERLFGDLARPTGTRPASAFSLEDLRRDFQGESLSSEERQQATRCLAIWEEAYASLQSNPNVTWGDLVAGYNALVAEGDRDAPPLFLDANELASVGIHADTPIASTQISLAELLSASNVTLIADEQSSLLTALPVAAAPPRRLAMPGVLVQTIPLETHRYTSVAAWTSSPPTPRTPWKFDSRSTAIDLAQAGWQRHPLSADMIEVAVYRWKALRGISWGVFLVIAGACTWIARYRRRELLVILAIAAIIALWLPTPLQLLGTAFFLGTVVGGFAGWITGSSLSKTKKEPAPAQVSASRALVTVGAVALVITHSAGSFTSAQEPARNDKANQEEAYRVLVPVDDQQRPQGEYVYLPKVFYEALARQAKNAKAVPQGWILYDASYRGRLQTAMAGGKLQVGDFTITYDLEVFQASTKVTIDLAREGLHLLTDHATLDGDEVAIEWLEAGQGFTLPIEKPGRYRLEVAVRPSTARVEGREQVDLRIPRVARSELTLQTPIDVANVQIAGAQGHATQVEPGNWRVDLGPTSRLTIYWTSSVTEDVTKDALEVSQLLWWKIERDAVVLTSQWTFKTTGDPLNEVRLIADPRLQLLPLTMEQPVAKQLVRAGDVQAIQLTLKEPYEREVTLQASFAMADTTGIGHLQLPRLEAVADRTTRRWLALTTDPTLDVSIDQGTRIETVVPQEFANAWGDTKVPAAAYRLDDQSLNFVIDVRPKQPQVSSRQALTYAMSAAHVQVELEALVDVAEGSLFMHRVQMPEEWRIEEATVTEGPTTLPARVAAGPSGQRTIFLPRAVTGEHRLLIKAVGDVKLGAWTLPTVALLGTSGDAPLVFLERDSSLGAKLVDHPGYDAVPDGSALPTRVDWRRFAVLRPNTDGLLRQLQLQLQKSNVRFDAAQLVTVMRRGDTWEAIVDVHGSAKGGSVEVLRFELPAETTTVQTSVPARIEMVSLPGQMRQHLVVGLKEPQSGDFKLRLTIPLGDGGVDRVVVPEVRLLDAEKVETFVALPGEQDGQPLVWDARGLQAGVLPPELSFGELGGLQIFIASGGRYQATLKRIERVAGVPQVRLAEVRTFVDGGKARYGVATFDLQPAGSSSCQLRLPAGQRLIHVDIAGVPAIARPLNATDYTIQLRHQQLPQRVEVLYVTSEDHDGTSRSQLAAPQLVGLPVERSLWTITTPSHSPLILGESLTTTDAARQASLRLKNAAALLEHAHTQSTEHDPEQTAAWLLGWSTSTLHDEAMVRQNYAELGLPPALAAELEALEDETLSVAQQWGVSEVLDVARRHPEKASTYTDLLLTQDSATYANVAVVLPGAATTIEASLANEDHSDLGQRVAAVLLVVALYCGALAVLKNRLLISLLDQAPHVVGVALGIGWWFLLTPSVVGLAIAALFAFAALRWPWPATHERSASGFTLRLPGNGTLR